MSNGRRRLLGMGLPCLLALALDATLTMRGQPGEYWAGDYSQTSEGAPFHRKLYAIHPAAAVAGYAAWASILIGLILLLPESLAVILAIAVVFGHTAGPTHGWRVVSPRVGSKPRMACFLLPPWFLGWGCTGRSASPVNGKQRRRTGLATP